MTLVPICHDLLADMRAIGWPDGPWNRHDENKRIDDGLRAATHWEAVRVVTARVLSPVPLYVR